MAEQGFDVRGQRVVVLGAARSGVAAAALLARRGAQVTLSESRPAFDGMEPLRAQGVTLELGGHRRETVADADLVVLSPGVPPDNPVLDAARARGVDVIGELELAWRWVQGPVIAITGTKGKSTTTTLVGRMLEAAGHTVLVGGNIGVPLSAQVDASTPETMHVVEASSFQLETTTSFRPRIAAWLNVADDHLDRHPDVASYVAAKARILAHLRAEDAAVLNADDPLVVAQSEGTAAQRIWFAPSGRLDEGFVVDGEAIVQRRRGRTVPILPTSAVELTGRHMLDNVTAAVAICATAGVSPDAMREGLRGFRGLEHVMEAVGQIGRVRFVNDSKATNVEAARRSIESFESGVVAIVGGRYKSGDLRELAAPLRTRGRSVIAIGEAASRVRNALGDVLPVVDAASMGEAVERAYQAALPDGVVLLAPACASFDWYRDYAERGRAFKQEVARLRGRVVVT